MQRRLGTYVRKPVHSEHRINFVISRVDVPKLRMLVLTEAVDVLRRQFGRQLQELVTECETAIDRGIKSTRKMKNLDR